MTLLGDGSAKAANGIAETAEEVKTTRLTVSTLVAESNIATEPWTAGWIRVAS